MTILTTLEDFREDMGCDIIQLPDTSGLRYYNDSRDEVIGAITKENEGYFYDYLTGATVIWQNEYSIPKRWDTVVVEWVPIVLPWVQKIKWVSVKQKSTDTEFTKYTPTDFQNLDYDIESYKTTNNPFYCVLDNSIFIYPSPTEVNDYRIYGIMMPKKLELTDDETLPDHCTKAILYWIKKRFLERQTRIAESQQADSEFEKEKIKVAQALSGRIIEPVQREVPNLNYLS